MDREDSKPSGSGIFRMNRGMFARRLFLFYGTPWFIFFSLCVGLGLILGFFISEEWFILSLMVVFLIIPMAFALLYFYHGLKRECYLNIVDHTVYPNEDGLDVKLLFPVYSDDEQTNGEKMEEVMKDGKDEVKMIEFSIPYSDIEGVKIDGGGVYYIVKSPHRGFVWLPETAYTNPEEFVKTVNYVSKRILS